MSWSFNNQQPIYLQLVQGIKTRMIQGQYPPGTQMPTVRQLADEARVNPNTVQKAMTQLEKEALVFSKGTVGRFVADDPQLPQKLQRQIAKTTIEEFLQSMTDLGLSTAQVVDIIQELAEEETL